MLYYPLPVVNVSYLLSAVDFGHKLDTSDLSELFSEDVMYKRDGDRTFANH